MSICMTRESKLSLEETSGYVGSAICPTTLSARQLTTLPHVIRRVWYFSVLSVAYDFSGNLCSLFEFVRHRIKMSRMESPWRREILAG